MRNLQEYLTESEKTHEFRLTKKNGDLTRDFYQFIEIILRR